MASIIGKGPHHERADTRSLHAARNGPGQTSGHGERRAREGIRRTLRPIGEAAGGYAARGSQYGSLMPL